MNTENIYIAIITNLDAIVKQDGGYQQYKYNKTLYLKFVNTNYTSNN
jgi:hypothetical protein